MSAAQSEKSMKKSPLPSKGSKGSIVNVNDHDTFFAPSIPLEVKECINLFNSSLPDDRQGIIALHILRDILKASPIGEDGKSLAELQTSLELNSILDGDQFGIIYTGLYRILHTALRRKVKLSEFAAHLGLLHMPQVVITTLGKAYAQLLNIATQDPKASVISAQLIPLNSCRWLPTIQKVKWRVDVTISSGSLSRVMRPNISIQFVLSDGRIKTFDVSIEQFHQLRHGTAKLLYDIQTLKRHPIMKIINEFKVREDEEVLR